MEKTASFFVESDSDEFPIQAAWSRATDTRSPNGFKISCKVSRVGWPCLERILERLGSATYYFASGGNRYEFLRDAPRYQPQFGGYCAASLARGRLEDINPHLFVIYEGKLYLFNHPEAEALFMRDPRRTISEAR